MFSSEGCTIFDGDAGCIDIAHKNGRFLQLNALDTVQVSVHSPLDHRVAGLQFGADTSVRPDSKTAIEQFDTAFKMPAFSSSSKVLLAKAVFSRFLNRVHNLVGSLDHFVHGFRRRPECHCTYAESDWPVVSLHVLGEHIQQFC